MQKVVSKTLNNQTEPGDRPFHSWYQFVLGYPPHFVRYCLTKFDIRRGQFVLDPFCGTGTTNVECKRLGINSLGLEANPMTEFAAQVKTNWEVSPGDLESSAQRIAKGAARTFRRFGIAEEVQLFYDTGHWNENSIPVLEREPRLSEEQEKILPKDFISEKPLRKVLILRDLIEQDTPNLDLRNALLLALANVTVNQASNLAFGPEIYATGRKKDASLVSSFRARTRAMASDLRTKPKQYASARIKLGDARRVSDYFGGDAPVHGVITSPPYPNEKDYTRMTRLESVVFGFMRDRQSLREVKANLLRSNSRNIFVNDTDDQYIRTFRPVTKLAAQIEERRIELGKTSGFERLYHKIVTHYFGGMYRHLESLKKLLAPGVKLAYVVGDQMSFFRINIPTADLLGKMAEDVGYRVEGIELWRTRLSTATKLDLNENILVLSYQD